MIPSLLAGSIWSGLLPATSHILHTIPGTLLSASRRSLSKCATSPAVAAVTPTTIINPKYDILPGCGAVPNVEGHVHSTESFSAIDGPGVRFLVFLQGCAMRCLFCSNPDTWDPHGGQKTTTKAIAEEIRHVLPYIKQGGVTCSGGEPLLQPQFTAALFQEAHAMGLTTCLDTTGQGSKHHHWDLVLPHTDLVLFCIKHLDPVKYEKMTGLKQGGALKFAHELEVRKIPYYLRYVMVPGMSDSKEDFERLKDFALKQPTLQGIELLPYHLLGMEKWGALGLRYPLEGVPTPSKDAVHAARADLEAAGLKVLCDVK